MGCAPCFALEYIQSGTTWPRPRSSCHSSLLAPVGALYDISSLQDIDNKPARLTLFQENEKYNCLSHVSPALLTTGQHFVARSFIVQGKTWQEFPENSSAFWVEIWWRKGGHWGDMYTTFFRRFSFLPITSSALFALGHRTCAAFPQQCKTHPEKTEFFLWQNLTMGICLTDFCDATDQFQKHPTNDRSFEIMTPKLTEEEKHSTRRQLLLKMYKDMWWSLTAWIRFGFRAFLWVMGNVVSAHSYNFQP